jgi:peptide/nickel transport system substrate-binding protein
VPTTENLNNLNKSYPSESGGTLVDAMIGEPSGLIYMIAGESASSAISSNIFNKLLKYNKNLDLEGELAESWDISADQKTITFKLKPNLKWADGKPLTSFGRGMPLSTKKRVALTLRIINL